MNPAEPPRPAGKGMRLAGMLAILAAEIAALAAAAPFTDFQQDGNAACFVGWLLLAGIFFLGAVRLFEELPTRWRPTFFWLGAIGLRLGTLAYAPADDFWRYLWEGRIQIAGWNPYFQSVNAESLAHLRDPVWELVRLRDWPAVYPPGAQLLFAFLVRIGESVGVFRACFFACEMLTLFLLVRINTGSGRFRASAWYAWNPVVAAFLIGGAHFDSVMILALTASLYALHRADPLRREVYVTSWTLLASVFLGLAISLKVVPFVLLPVWALALRKKAWVLLIAVAIPASLTFLYDGPEMVMASLLRFARDTQFNGLFWWLPELLTGKQYYNQLYHGILFVIVGVIAWFFRHDWRRGSLWAMGVALVLSPVLHPWYVIWILPIAAWRKVHGWPLLSLSALLALLVWDASPWWPEWEVTAPLRALILAPPLFWMAGEWWQKRRMLVES